MYFLNDFEMVPVAPIITGITLFLPSTCVVFLLSGPYILKSSRLYYYYYYYYYLKNRKISMLMKIRPVGAELFHGDGWTDAQL